MKRLLLLTSVFISGFASAQLNIDTLAFQDFETVPAAPVWTFTGPVIYNSGYSSPTATPANSPLGIGGSRAWETTTNSGGLVLDFANTTIPAGYDSIRVRFNLAAMNLNSAGGGPDNLDYVLVAYSTDGGVTFNNRIRVRGATTDNSTWAYSATGVANRYYLPATETVFQPTTSGPQTTFGYSTVEISFPGAVTQIAMRITGRSSSSTDTWLVDNLVLTGENSCANTTSSITASACNMYVAPSGDMLMASGTYLDTIPNATGCDSVITINLTINSSSGATVTASACNMYVTPSGNMVTTSGTYYDTIPNAAGCDSVITINLTINSSSGATVTASACGNYTLPGGAVVTSSGTYYDTIPNMAGCDSVITANITINASSSFTQSITTCFMYSSPSGNVYTTSGTYMDTIPNSIGCDSVITTQLTIDTVDVSVMMSGATLQANATPATYQWIDCNNGNAPVAGATNQSFMPAVNGNYAVIVTQGSCTDTSACVNVTSVGMNENNVADFSVAPNPSSGIFNITGQFSNAAIVITDVQGKICHQQNAVNGTLYGVDLSAQPAGVYFVRVADEQGARTVRVVKL